MLTVRGQRHLFSIHERVFLWKCQSFWDRKCLDLRGTRTPNLRNHAECFNYLSYQGQTFIVPCFLIIYLNSHRGKNITCFRHSIHRHGCCDVTNMLYILSTKCWLLRAQTYVGCTLNSVTNQVMYNIYSHEGSLFANVGIMYLPLNILSSGPATFTKWVQFVTHYRYRNLKTD